MTTTNGRPHHKFDYHEELVGYLTSAVNGPNMQALVRVFAEGCQTLEDVLQGVISQRVLDEAVGVHLDAWGRLVGEPRGGLDDGSYRAFIKARILSNRSQGQAETIINVLGIIGRSDDVLYWPLPPAAYSVQFVTPFPNSPALQRRIRGQLEDITAAGVEVGHIIEAEEGAFGWEEDPTALGFDSGGFAEVI